MGSSKSKPNRVPVVIPTKTVIASNYYNYESESKSFESITETSSESSEILYETLSIHELMTELSLEDNTKLIDKILLSLENKINKITQSEIIKFWDDNGNIILSKIKHNPSACISLKMNTLPRNSRNTFMEKLGMFVFDTHNNDALMLLGNNMGIIVFLLRSRNIDQSVFLANDNIPKDKMLKYAYSSLSKGNWGMSYILFKKAGYHKEANNMIDQRAPEYIKLLFDK